VGGEEEGGIGKEERKFRVIRSAQGGSLWRSREQGSWAVQDPKKLAAKKI